MGTAGDRFAEALDSIYGKSSSRKASEKLDIPQTSIDRLKRKPNTTKQMLQIAHNEGISIVWLETGEGEMLQSVEVREQMSSADVVSEPNAPYEKYRKEAMIKVTYNKEIYASAGGGATNGDDSKSEELAFAPSFLEKQFGVGVYKGLNIITATGNSMEPTIVSGELLFINPFENEDHHIKDTAIYVINCTNGVYVKRVVQDPFAKTITLVSDNSSIGDMVLKDGDMDGCKIIGRVIGHCAVL